LVRFNLSCTVQALPWIVQQMSPPTLGLLDDCLELEAFAQEIKRHPRTVKRWMHAPNGLPFTRPGKTPIIHVPTAWMLGRMRRPNQRKRRGAA
jgi:hypothetical protein